jgi:hypothetical protein
MADPVIFKTQKVPPLLPENQAAEDRWATTIFGVRGG